MAKKDFSDAFVKFENHEVKTAHIKALGADIQYRELTMSEVDAFSKRLVKGYGADGKTPELDFDAANEIKYEKAALALVSPTKTADELKAYLASFLDVINEINILVDGDDVEVMDKEGN